VATAQTGEEEQEAAEFAAKGVELYKRGFWMEAIQHFVAAQGLVPDPTNLYNIARCYDHQGNFKKAADYYQQYIDAGGKNVEKARNYLESIKAMPAVVNVISTPPGAMVLVDDNKLFSGMTPLKSQLKPGKHKILVKLDGYGVQWREVELTFDDDITLEFTLHSIEETSDMDVGEDIVEVDEGPAPPDAPGEVHDASGGGSHPEVVNLVSGAAGLSFPVSFEQVHSFVGASLMWQFIMRGGGAGLGMDLQFGGNAQIYAFYAHGGYSLEFGPGFFVFGRAGAGVGLLRCRHGELEVCAEIPVSFLARMTVGMGWSRGWFDVRLAAANFLLHVWVRQMDGVTAQWMPLLQIGYRY
jgi:hypothetical protein